MTKSKALIIAALVIIVVVGGYFVITGIQLRQAEFEMLEELRKPKAHLGFWNKSDKQLLIKITYETGDIRWLPLTPGGGSYGSYDIGKVRIERILDEKNLAAISVSFNKGADVQFDVYEDKIVPSNGPSNQSLQPTQKPCG